MKETNPYDDGFFCIVVALRDPTNETVLIEGVLFRANYLGSTQLISEGQPSKGMRMMQAQEAVGRIKVRVSVIYFNDFCGFAMGMYRGSFKGSFIQAISIAPLQVHYYSEVLPTQHGYCVRVSCRSATGNCE